MVEDILAWEPEGPVLLTRVDLAGRTPLHFAVRHGKIDAVDLLLQVDSHLACIPNKRGFCPLHHAAIWGSTRMFDQLIKRCPEYYELVDDKGMNLLHLAVKGHNDTVVRYICQNERFSMLLNVKDFKGDTPLHLAVKNGYMKIVSILLQSKGVELNITNRDGLSARDLAYIGKPRRRINYLLEPANMVFHCLRWAGAIHSLDLLDTDKADVEEETTEKDYTKGTIASALIASVTFAAAFTMPGGFIADDHPHPGTAILARRFAFRAFVVSDTVAFLCSIVATGFLIYIGVTDIPCSLHVWYTHKSFLLVPTAAQFMIAAFAFGLHLVLGIANRWLVIFVYMVASASVLFISSNTWIALYVYGFAKAIWRRAGWKGLLNMHERPSGPIELFGRLFWSPLAMFSGGSFALPMCATFLIAITLEITLPNF